MNDIIGTIMEKKTYQKPATKFVVLSSAADVMQVVVNPGGMVQVSGEDNPDDPDLANSNSIWDEDEEIRRVKEIEGDRWR